MENSMNIDATWLTDYIQQANNTIPHAGSYKMMLALIDYNLYLSMLSNTSENETLPKKKKKKMKKIPTLLIFWVNVS